MSPTGPLVRARDLRTAVGEATKALAAVGIESAEHDAVALAAHAAGQPVAEVRRTMLLGAPVPTGYVALVEQRALRIPLQHLTGRQGFRRLELSVGPGVFVPRPETEMVAGLAIDAAHRIAQESGTEPLVVDLCAGSGAIAFSVKDEEPRARVHAVEISQDAFVWLQRNRDELGLDVELHHDDATRALIGLDGEVDVVVSNPPYIPTHSVPNDPEVRDHDPRVALYGGSSDGLAIPRLVAARAATLLRSGGVLVMEHADVQGATLPTALHASGSWSRIRDLPDLSGRPRAVVAVRSATE